MDDGNRIAFRCFSFYHPAELIWVNIYGLNSFKRKLIFCYHIFIWWLKVFMWHFLIYLNNWIEIEIVWMRGAHIELSKTRNDSRIRKKILAVWLLIDYNNRTCRPSTILLRFLCVDYFVRPEDCDGWIDKFCVRNEKGKRKAELISFNQSNAYKLTQFRSVERELELQSEIETDNYVECSTTFASIRSV